MVNLPSEADLPTEVNLPIEANLPVDVDPPAEDNLPIVKYLLTVSDFPAVFVVVLIVSKA